MASVIVPCIASSPAPAARGWGIWIWALTVPSRPWIISGCKQVLLWSPSDRGSIQALRKQRVRRPPVESDTYLTDNCEQEGSIKQGRGPSSDVSSSSFSCSGVVFLYLQSSMIGTSQVLHPWRQNPNLWYLFPKFNLRTITQYVSTRAWIMVSLWHTRLRISNLYLSLCLHSLTKTNKQTEKIRGERFAHFNFHHMFNLQWSFRGVFWF